MSEKHFLLLFKSLTRLVFTVITAEAAIFLQIATAPVMSFADACVYRNLPVCVEHLLAAMVLYLLMAAAATAALKESST